MDDYEYRTVRVPGNPKKQSRELSKLGKDGWELIQVKHVLGAGIDRATLRRPASAKAANQLATGTLGLQVTRDQLIGALGALPSTLRRTLTWDRGSEMAKHAEVTAAIGTLVYFCDPASPWQRASNENANGLLRQYFQKGADLSALDEADVRFATDEINGRPRAVLAWATAADRFASYQGSGCHA